MKNCNIFLEIKVNDDKKISEFIEQDSKNLDIFIICMYYRLNKYFILGYYDKNMKYFPLPLIEKYSIEHHIIKIITSAIELDVKDIRKYKFQRLFLPNKPTE